MKRRMFSILAALSLVLVIATAGLWAVSYWRVAAVYYEPAGIASRSERGYVGSAIHGGLSVGWYEGSWTGSGWRIASGLLSDVPMDVDWTFGLWFSYLSLPEEVGGGVVQVPLWFPTLLLLVLPLIWLRRHRRVRHRQRPGLCRRCGYDLRAHGPGHKCPECGTVVPEDVAKKEIA